MDRLHCLWQAPGKSMFGGESGTVAPLLTSAAPAPRRAPPPRRRQCFAISHSHDGEVRRVLTTADAGNVTPIWRAGGRRRRKHMERGAGCWQLRAGQGQADGATTYSRAALLQRRRSREHPMNVMSADCFGAAGSAGRPAEPHEWNVCPAPARGTSSATSGTNNRTPQTPQTPRPTPKSNASSTRTETGKARHATQHGAPHGTARHRTARHTQPHNHQTLRTPKGIEVSRPLKRKTRILRAVV